MDRYTSISGKTSFGLAALFVDGLLSTSISPEPSLPDLYSSFRTLRNLCAVELEDGYVSEIT